MARGGLYQSEVRKARDSLLAQGKNPSIDAVRVALGNTGSKTTIHRYLKELEAEEGAGTGVKVAVSDALQDLVGRLAGRLHEEADTLIAEAKQRSDAVLKERSEVIDQQKQELAGLSAQLQRTEVALQAEKTEHVHAKRQLQEQAVTAAQREERIAGLASQLAERDAHVQSLEEKHQHAREALEHYRNSVKEQRDQEQRRHEHQVQELQVALRQANELVAAKNQNLLTLNRDNERLTNQIMQLGKDNHRQQQDNHRLEREVKELQALVRGMPALRGEVEQAVRNSEQLRLEAETAQRDLDTQQKLRRQAEAELTRLQGRAQALETIVADLKPYLDKRESAKAVS